MLNTSFSSHCSPGIGHSLPPERQISIFFQSLISEAVPDPPVFQSRGRRMTMTVEREFPRSDSRRKVAPANKEVQVMRPEHLVIRGPMMLHPRWCHSGCTEIPWSPGTWVAESHGREWVLSDSGFLTQAGRRTAYLMSTPKSQGPKNNQISRKAAFDPAPGAA